MEIGQGVIFREATNREIGQTFGVFFA